MTPEDIRPLLAADPFQKFHLHTTDGGEFEVADPAAVSFTPSGGALVYDAKGRRTLIALGHVVSVSFPSAAGDPFFLRGR